ncbi:MAG: DUF3301 domain-containing protein [Gammaproteobacteria bacterium]
MTEILWLCITLLGVWFVFDSLGAREAANEAAKTRCDRDGLQFLDGTVAYASIKLVRFRDGIALRRIFRFEFTIDGDTRLGGFVTTLGKRVDAVDLPPAAYH